MCPPKPFSFAYRPEVVGLGQVIEALSNVGYPLTPVEA